jgi:hypothetical protein
VHLQEDDNPQNGEVLIPMYTRYGFHVVDETVCPMEMDPNEVAMCMENIQEDVDLVKFRSRILSSLPNTSKKRAITQRNSQSQRSVSVKQQRVSETGGGSRNPRRGGQTRKQKIERK